VRGRRNLWLLILGAVFFASWFFGRQTSGDEAPAALPQAAEAPPAAAPAWSETEPEEAPIHLRILNGTPQPGLARDFSLLLGRAGCVAETVDNAPHDHFAASLLVDRRLGEDRARALARRFGGIPVVHEWDRRASEDAVLILGADHDALRRRLTEVTAGK
jgi:hypothetical protein